MQNLNVSYSHKLQQCRGKLRDPNASCLCPVSPKTLLISLSVDHSQESTKRVGGPGPKLQVLFLFFTLTQWRGGCRYQVSQAARLHAAGPVRPAAEGLTFPGWGEPSGERLAARFPDPPAPVCAAAWVHPCHFTPVGDQIVQDFSPG